MARTRGIFRPGVSALEGRRLLSATHGLAPSEISLAGGDSLESLQVLQTEGVANLAIDKSRLAGAVTLRVTTLPSPAVGVVVAPVDEVVTIPADASSVPLTIPLVEGAPNPGQMDVPLELSVVGSPQTLVKTYKLRVFASAADLPPTVASAQMDGNDIQITFSKPMNPASVQDVRDYVTTRTVEAHSSWSNLFGGLGSMLGPDNAYAQQRFALKSATYDPATMTVTLVPVKSATPLNGVTVTAAKSVPSPHHRGAQAATPAPPLPLTDLAGNTLNGGAEGSLQITP